MRESAVYKAVHEHFERAATPQMGLAVVLHQPVRKAAQACATRATPHGLRCGARRGGEKRGVSASNRRNVSICTQPIATSKKPQDMHTTRNLLGVLLLATALAGCSHGAYSRAAIGRLSLSLR